MKLTNAALVLSGLLAITACGGGSGDKSGVPAGTVPENTSQVDPTANASAISYNDIAVHDPSVIKGDDGYYVFGSHLAAAKSTDLMSWQYISVLSANDQVDESPLFNTYSSEIAEGIAWTDGYKGSWAPDVIKAPNGKYWFYYDHCAQTEADGGCWNRSYLGVAESDSISGPYVNKGIFLRSGYRNADEFTAHPLDNDQTTYDPSIDPNVIDPTAFFDKDGKLWLVYGSYSGGIYVLAMDNTTGLPIAGQGYGKHVAGGGFAAIEGSWITYSPETGYYYMFNSIAGFDAAGGYNIRVSRSQNPDGPYVDAAGNDMLLAKNNTDTLSKYGVKLMGGFNFVAETGDEGESWGYLSPGHNSVYYDEAAKKYFLITHARFPGRGEEHSVRVHELWLNHDGWFVASPQRYAPIAGDNIVDAEDLVGDYRFINHQKDSNKTGHDSVYIRLNEDRTITGELTGYYVLSDTDSKRIKLVIGNKTYDGIMAWQWDDSIKKLVPTFSAISIEGVSVWGSQLPARTTAEAVTDITDAMVFSPEVTDPSLTLSLRGTRGAEITWESSNSAVVNLKRNKLTNKLTGVAMVHRPSATLGDQVVTLTATINVNGETFTHAYTVTVPALKVIPPAAEFKFEDNLDDSTGNFAAGTATGDRLFNTGAIAYAPGVDGNALSLDGTNGVLLPSGLISSYSYTVSMWVKPNALSLFTPTFFGATTTDNWTSFQLQNWWNQQFTLWSLNTPDWYDCATGTNLTLGEWNHISYSVDQGLVNIYVNGTKLCSKTGLGDIFSAATGTFSLGVNYWDSPFNGLIDDVKIFNSPIAGLDASVLDPGTRPAADILGLAKNMLTLGDLSAVKDDLELPLAGAYTAAISWSSSNPTVVDNNGVVTRPGATEPDAEVTLTATLSYGGQTLTKDFNVVVKSNAPPVPSSSFSFEDNLDEGTNSLGAGTVVGSLVTSVGSGQVGYVNGVVGKALVLDGASGVLLPENLITDNTYSISMWLNPSVLTDFTTAFFGYVTADNWISVVPGGGPGGTTNSLLWGHNGGSNWSDGLFGTRLAVNTWTHVVMTVDNGTLKTYINGQLSNTVTGFQDVFTSAGTSQFALGVNYWDTPYNGKIDELKVYDIVLSAADIAVINILETPQ